MRTIKLGAAVRAYSDNFLRFPLASIVAHIGVFCAVGLILQRYNNIDTHTQRVLATILSTCMIVFPLSIMAEHLGRGAGRNAQIWQLGTIVGALLVGCLLYFRYTETDDWMVMSVLLLGAASHLFFAFLPFLQQNENRNIWEFNRQMLANLAASLAFGFILWGGVGAAILAIDKLFEFNIDGEVYGSWTALSWGFMSTSYFMYHFPDDLDFSREEMQFHQPYLTLSKYILIPITLLYFFILYAYGLKILAQWQLPKGWVSSLCIGFSVAGILAWLLNYLLPEYNKGWLHIQFKRWFWPMTFPIIALLTFGIGRRISDYGVTEDRYVVAMIALCFLVNALYFTFRAKDKQRLWFLPFSVAAACLVTVFGPFDARNVSMRNQKSSLLSMMEASGITKDGVVQKFASAKTVDADLIQKLNFIGDRDSNMLVKILQLQPEDCNKIREQSGGLYSWGIVNYLKLEAAPDTNSQGSYYSLSNVLHQGAYEINGAKYKLSVPSYVDYEDLNPPKGYRLLFGGDLTNYYLQNNSMRVDTFSTAPVLDLMNKFVDRTQPQYYGSDSIPPIKLVGRNHTLLLMPMELGMRRDSTGKLFLESINADFYLME
jgi:hypothetical protein